MKILILAYPLYPHTGNNANLLLKLVPCLKREHEVHILSLAPSEDMAGLPQELSGIPVHWAFPAPHRFFYKIAAKIVDGNGYSDALLEMYVRSALASLYDSYPYEAILSSMEPFFMAAALSRIPNVKKALYLMDPPACTLGSQGTAYRNRSLKKILLSQNRILTTPFIRQALTECGYACCADKMTEVGFPMIEDTQTGVRSPKKQRIDLLFCGWLYSDIRSPEYFLEIVSRLDSRFRVTFMGRNCEKLTERFPVRTDAELITLPQQPYEKALRAMAQADILINIGNSVPVHMPSKTLEYINTGKPFVNFYKLTDCPTLNYTTRYPLCLNLSEGGDPARDAESFVRFCESRRGETVDRGYLIHEFGDCTAEHIARKLTEGLEDK